MIRIHGETLIVSARPFHKEAAAKILLPLRNPYIPMAGSVAIDIGVRFKSLQIRI
jgi:hypothetical protein